MTRQERERVLKSAVLEKIQAMFELEGQEVLQTGVAQIDLPMVDCEGNELFVTVALKIPRGTRDGVPYDAYGEAEFFQEKKKEPPPKKGRKPKAKVEEEEKAEGNAEE